MDKFIKINRVSSFLFFIVTFSPFANFLYSTEWEKTETGKNDNEYSLSPITKRQRITEPQPPQYTLTSNDRQIIQVPSDVVPFIKVNNQLLHHENNFVDLPATTINSILLFLNNIEEPYSEYTKKETPRNWYNLLYKTLHDRNKDSLDYKLQLYNQLDECPELSNAFAKLGLQTVKKLRNACSDNKPDALDQFLYDERLDDKRPVINNYVQSGKLIEEIKKFLLINVSKEFMNQGLLNEARKELKKKPENSFDKS